MKAIEYQALSSYLGMSPKAYVARGLAIKRAVELGGTEVGGAPLTGGGSITSPTSLPTTKPKRGYRIIDGEIYHDSPLEFHKAKHCTVGVCVPDTSAKTKKEFR